MTPRGLSPLQSPMQEHALDGHLARPVAIDLCFGCQSFWFDAHESLALTPGSTLALFRVIGEHAARSQPTDARPREVSALPRRGCAVTHDMQRDDTLRVLSAARTSTAVSSPSSTSCKEKDFIRPLTPGRSRSCARTCRPSTARTAARRSTSPRQRACTHCGSPLSMLDMEQAEALVAQLQRADRSDGSPSIRPCR